MKMACYLCQSQEYELRHNRVRDRDDINVLECVKCGLVYLSSIEHINDEFYEESGMMNGNVHLNSYRKNSAKDDQRRFEFLKEDLINETVLILAVEQVVFYIWQKIRQKLQMESN